MGGFVFEELNRDKEDEQGGKRREKKVEVTDHINNQVSSKKYSKG